MFSIFTSFSRGPFFLYYAFLFLTSKHSIFSFSWSFLRWNLSSVNGHTQVLGKDSGTQEGAEDRVTSCGLQGEAAPPAAASLGPGAKEARTWGTLGWGPAPCSQKAPSPWVPKLWGLHLKARGVKSAAVRACSGFNILTCSQGRCGVGLLWAQYTHLQLGCCLRVCSGPSILICS